MEHKNLVVCKSNKVIEAGYKLTLMEQRLVQACMAQVDSVEELLKTDKFELSAKDFAKLYEISEESAYNELKEVSKQLFSRYVIIDNPDPEKPKIKQTITHWITSIDYIPDEGKIVLCFAPKILPYLGQLKGNFTYYRLENISKMTCIYAIRLYELMMQWKTTGKREIEIDWLKKQFQLDASYNRMDNFKGRVIDPAVKDINKHSNYTVSWTQRKTGRKVTHLIFAFSEKSPEGEKPKRITKPKEKMILGVPMSEIEKHARIGETHEQAAGRINHEKNTTKTPAPKTTTATPKTPTETNKEQNDMRIEVIKSLINKNKAFYLEEFNRKGFVAIKGINGAIIEPDLKLAGLFD